MPQVELPDRVFWVAQDRAARAGFPSVSAYLSDVVLGDEAEVEAAGDGFDAARFFTPERLAELDAAETSIRDGRGLTLEQVDAELARRRAEWIKANNG